ncbi:GH25 family lysozyme [Arthrobacter citreus]|uniref:GH25 family lysozyme n=1 Tax=Arthrobacter citreus TaxID=1670 RepID=UPI0036D8F2E3
MTRTNFLLTLSGIALSVALPAGFLPAVAVTEDSAPSLRVDENTAPATGDVPTPTPSPLPQEGPGEGAEGLSGSDIPLPPATPADSVPETGSAEKDWLAELIGPLGAKLGQGLERLEETGDPQVPTVEEQVLEAKAEEMVSAGEAPAGPAAAAAENPGVPSARGAVHDSRTAYETAGISLASVVTLASTWRPAGIQGIDVSSHQFNVDWLGAWNQGARFAYVKATEATSYINPYYPQQYNGSHTVGMYRGAYHFAIPNVSSGAEQANYFVNNGGGWSADGRTLPPLLDIEYNPYSSLGNTCYNMSASQMVAWIADFSRTIKARTGRLPMIYTTTDWWRTCTGNSAAFHDHPLHIANYSTAGPGQMPAGWNTYNVWQYSSTGPFVGDSNVWNGSDAALYDFAVRQPQTPSIASAADVVAVGPDGTLLNYRAAGGARLHPPLAIGTQWSGMLSVHSTDWNADGVQDILAQTPAGNLNVYYGLAGGGFAGPVTVGQGWSQLRISVGSWGSSSTFPGIVASDSRGRGWFYPNTSGGVMASPPAALGSGFNGTLTTLMDFNGDGVQEVIQRLANGDLVSRARTASGAAAAPVTIGTGWQDAVGLRSISGFAGPGSIGILAEFSNGDLRYYGASGTGYWYSPITSGSGWGPYLLANTQALGTPPGPSISSASDIVAVNPNGDLLVYRAMLGGALQGPAKIGVGFHGVKSIHAMDWNRDGTMDIVVQWSKGTVDVYHGLAQGGFGGARNIGTAGWETMTVYPDPVVSQSGLPGLLARDTTGKLRRYTNPDGVSYLQGGTVIGEGWNGFKLVSLDWNGDGISDILAVNPSGNMAYYRRTASGSFAQAAPATVGTGWQDFATLRAGHDVTGAGTASVLGVDRRGSLYNYRVTGTGWWADVQILGTGWDGLLLAGN